MNYVLQILKAPLDDYLAALEACSSDRRFIVLVPLAAVVSWFAYVPMHELLHAYGCLWTGGEVTRLEIDAIYGAAFLQRWFPFVAVGSDYAGQLTGFDTHGSDWVYLATDALPFLLTILIGVPLLRSAAASTAAPAAVKLGAAIPIAYAPFLSLPGDYYEMGSIIASRWIASSSSGVSVARWRSDDLFKLIESLSADGSAIDWVAVGGGVALAFLLAWLTYWAGAVLANWLGIGRVVPR